MPMEIRGLFEDYFKTFPQHEMNQLKWAHTCRVVEEAEAIARGEAFPSALAELGVLAAWLHDTGRFLQYQKYGTFSDRVSVNHALLSCAEVLRMGWLDTLTADARNKVLRAIECHNLKSVPKGLEEDEALLVHLVRDADKIDIFTVLDDALSKEGYLEHNPSLYWGLPFKASPSERVVRAILKREAIDYKEIKSFADFVFIQLGWCAEGIHFATAAKRLLERREIEIRQAFLMKILPQDEAVISACCAAAESALKEQAYGA